jgi:hypothetical protein
MKDNRDFSIPLDKLEAFIRKLIFENIQDKDLQMLYQSLDKEANGARFVCDVDEIFK